MDAGQESPTGLVWAALASLGAGVIHAAAVGVHGEHRQAAIAFAALALFQVGWGALALVRSWSWIAWAGVAGNSLALAGWLVAKTSGIGFIDGLETAEGPGFADTMAAILALIAVAGALTAAVAPELLRMPSISTVPVAAVTAAVVMAAMVATGGHQHGPGGHGHEDAAAIGAHDDDHEHQSGDGHGSDDDHSDMTGDDHDHAGTGDDHSGDDHSTGDDHGHGTNTNHDHGTNTDPDDHDHDPSTPPHEHPNDPEQPPHEHPDDPEQPPHLPRPYDATLPVDLSGFPGVSPEQQARAEALVTASLTKLPAFASTSTAYAAGYRSIGDSVTGYEHYINWSMTNDGHELDADHPESLVYQVMPGGGRRLVAAMYLLEPPRTLDQVPDLGGPMTQFHEHNDLCWYPPEGAWQVALVGPPPIPCPSGARRLEVVPMIHVWIVPSECGPFAALEGASGGQIQPGEQVLCDHVHGSH
jgi:hypothetical protein